MKRVLKSSLSFILAITIILSSAIVGLAEVDFSRLFEVKANAASVDGLTFTLNKDGESYSVTDCNTSASGLVIPNTYNGLPVTSIGNYAFYDCDSLTLLTIGDGVTSIGDYAFYDCNSITLLTIGDGVTSIGSYAFYCCNSITSVTIGNGVTSIGDYAFSFCESLTSVYITDISKWCNIAFEDYSSNPLRYAENLYINGELAIDVIIPDSVTSIGDYAFYDCDSITSITVPASVTSIGSFAFYCCDSLTAINVDSANSYYTSFGGVLFNKGKTTLIQYPIGKTATTYTIPGSVTSIGARAFRGCTSLTSVTIPDSVTSIGGYAFYDCNSITSVAIGNGITSIGYRAFYHCDSLTSVFITDITAWCNIDFEKSSSNPLRCAENLYINGELATDVIIPVSVTSIKDYAFYNCISLTSITIPDSVMSIGDFAFYSTGYYNDVNNWEDGVLYINNHLIEAEESLSGACEIKDGIKTIADYAFSDCTSLTSITIPDSVTSIGENAFFNCTSLTSVYITDIAKWCNISFYDSDSNPLDYAKKLYINEVLATNVVIPDGATSIGDEAFRNCDSLTSVTIPDSVTSIGYWAFYDCTSLTSITIGDGVKSIGNCAFDNCTSLTSIDVDSANSHYTSVDGVLFNKEKTTLIQYPIGKTATTYTIPNSVTSIGDYAFYCCESLASVTIGNGVTSIGDYAFCDCFGLTSAFITDITAWCNIDFENSFSNPLRYAENLYINGELATDVIIPDSVTSIRDYVFYNCISLTSITIPDSVMSIGDFAFYDCDNFTSITIPDSVTSIGACALGYADSLYGMEKINGFTIYGKRRSAAETYANENKFTFIEKTDECTHSSTKWIIDKEATVYAAGTKHKECTDCGAVLETAKIPQLKPATPKLSSVANTASGVKVTWGAVEGADNYIVYRRTYNAKTKKWGGWSKLADGVTSTSYVDKTAKSGTYYIYTVKANNEAGYGGHTSGLKTYFLSTPKVTSTANTNNAITVKWGKVAGATGYYVYRKTTGGWTRVGETTGTSFTDKTAKAGVTYRYTVRAYYGSYLSSFVAKGYAVRRLTTPSLKSVTSAKSGVTFKWNKVTGATGYIVYRKTGNGSWQRLATVKTNSYLDKTAKKGVTYKYTVRAYYGTSTSYYNTKGLAIKDKY